MIFDISTKMFHTIFDSISLSRLAGLLCSPLGLTEQELNNHQKPLCEINYLIKLMKSNRMMCAPQNAGIHTAFEGHNTNECGG